MPKERLDAAERYHRIHVHIVERFPDNYLPRMRYFRMLDRAWFNMQEAKRRKAKELEPKYEPMDGRASA